MDISYSSSNNYQPNHFGVLDGAEDWQIKSQIQAHNQNQNQVQSQSQVQNLNKSQEEAVVQVRTHSITIWDPSWLIPEPDYRAV